CTHCENLSELKKLRQTFESSEGQLYKNLNQIEGSVQGGFDEIKNVFSEGISEISEGISEISDNLSILASAIKWGFQELSWRLQQQTSVLLSINHTLRTPSETQANEWREMAEELRRRVVLDESEEFYLKALERNRLDYRIYVGLAETYLQSNKFDKAKEFLERSLPHAPKEGEFDYKSYSYRLIGHIYSCQEDYISAVKVLKTSIEVSPNYADGHYDYAQCSALTANKEAFSLSLEKAIIAKPLYWYIANKEQNFKTVTDEVQEILHSLKSSKFNNLTRLANHAENDLKEAKNALSRSRQALSKLNSNNSSQPPSNAIFINAEAKLKLVKEKINSDDYVAFLEAEPIAKEACSLAKEATHAAVRERYSYEEAYTKKCNQEEETRRQREEYATKQANQKALKNTKNIFAIILFSPIIGFICIAICGIGASVGAFIGYALSSANPAVAEAGFTVGFIITAIICVIFLIQGTIDLFKD
ncbi:MAG: tetratricopeptide repeat protein, partial [Crinalium sp.]